MTERRRAEEQLRELNDTLEQRVTERTEALQIASAALHETGERYRSLFDGSLDAIFFLDADERFKAANPAALRLTARTLEELKTIRFLDLCAPDQREAVETCIPRRLSPRELHDGYSRQSPSTGERRDLFISGDAGNPGRGSRRHLVHRARHYPAHQNRRGVTSQRSPLSGAHSSSSRCRVHPDERGRITLYNQAAVTLWGRDPEVGKDLWCGSWKIYRPDGTPLPLDECPMAVTLREGRAIRGEEIVIERPDGTRRHVLPHPEPMRNAEGVVVGAINMLIDITDRKQAERAIGTFGGDCDVF